MIEERIKDFFIQKGKADGLAYDTDLFSGGYIDSLFAFEMVVYLEETFLIKIGDSEITEDGFRTINSIAAIVGRIKGE